MLGVDGISDFAALHSRWHDDEVQFYAFDMPAGEGDDIRSLPLEHAQDHFAPLLAGRADGIFIAPFEHGEIGLDLFRAACSMGLEGLVSKHGDRSLRSRRVVRIRIRICFRNWSTCADSPL